MVLSCPPCCVALDVKTLPTDTKKQATELKAELGADFAQENYYGDTLDPDRQNVLAHQSEKLQEYEILTQRRSVEVYDTIRRANTFLIGWGMVFLSASVEPKPNRCRSLRTRCRAASPSGPHGRYTTRHWNTSPSVPPGVT